MAETNTSTNRKLTEDQSELLGYVRLNGGKTTAEIRRGMGFKFQGYESHLRDRLFRLADRGLIRFEEKVGKESGQVVARRWSAEVN